MGVDGETTMYDPFYSRAKWEYKFLLFPRKSEDSGKWIWFKRAYKGTRMITGPGTPVFEYRWFTKEEFMFKKLKGVI